MIPSPGGFTFAERPEVEAPDARIIWHADFDPGTLRVIASPIGRGDPDAIDPALLAPWLTLVRDPHGEHAVLSDGWHRITDEVADRVRRLVEKSLNMGPGHNRPPFGLTIY
ncbi:hypothetical protein [Sphingomonas sp.]|uniref:hypothetical protein n=1 Tax=Sphingomonas sp. TaxID=28214 RepID=UPI003F6EFA95